MPRVHDMTDSEQVLDDNLRVEWAKVQARKQHWEEEVLLVEEEMRRVVMFHKWKAQWWQSQAGRRSDADCSVLQGIAAYAEKQAHFCRCLAQSSVAAWLPTLKGNGAAPEDWEMRYSSMPAAANIAFSADNDDEESYESDEEGERGDWGEGEGYWDMDLLGVDD
jgi:hypothetical protein